MSKPVNILGYIVGTALMFIAALCVFSVASAATITEDSFSQTLLTAGTGSITVPALTTGAVTCILVNTANGNYTSSATFGGVVGTKLYNFSPGGSAGTRFYWLSVPAGGQTLTLSNADDTYAECDFLNNVNQTTPVEGSSHAAASAVTVGTTLDTFLVGSDRDFNVTVSSASPYNTPSNGSSLRWVNSGGMVSAGTLTNTWNAGSDTDLVAFIAAPDAPPPATTTPMTEVDNPVANTWYGFILFLAYMCFPIWFFKKRS